jgi:hypothetical protein
MSSYITPRAVQDQLAEIGSAAHFTLTAEFAAEASLSGRGTLLNAFRREVDMREKERKAQRFKNSVPRVTGSNEQLLPF